MIIYGELVFVLQTRGTFFKKVSCSWVDHHPLRAPEGLLFQQLHCLPVVLQHLESTFLPSKSLFASRNFPLESANGTTCGVCSSGWVEGRWDRSELAAGSWLCGCIRRCHGDVGLGAEQRGWDRDKAGVLGTLAGRVWVSVPVIVGTDESWSGMCWTYLVKLFLFSSQQLSSL